MAAAPSSSARRTVSGAFLRACGLGPFSGAAPSTRSRGPPPRERVACQAVLACGALWPCEASVTSLPDRHVARRSHIVGDSAGPRVRAVRVPVVAENGFERARPEGATSEQFGFFAGQCVGYRQLVA